MNRLVNRALYWTPRGLCIAFAAFISIFAADVFQAGVPAWQIALALLVHLIPTFILVAVLVLSWRREWIGGAVFVALGILYVVWAWGRPFARWFVLLVMAGPPILVGVLFLLNWRYRAQLRPGV